MDPDYGTSEWYKRMEEEAARGVERAKKSMEEAKLEENAMNDIVSSIVKEFGSDEAKWPDYIRNQGLVSRVLAQEARSKYDRVSQSLRDANERAAATTMPAPPAPPPPFHYTTEFKRSFIISEEQKSNLRNALKSVVESPHLVDMFGKLSILHNLVSQLYEIRNKYLVSEAKVGTEYVDRIIGDVNYLTGSAQSLEPSSDLVQGVIQPFLSGEQKDLQGLVTQWIRDQDAILRANIGHFTNFKNWKTNIENFELVNCKVLLGLMSNQNLYLTGIVRITTNMIANAFPDQAAQMNNASQLAAASTTILYQDLK